MSDLERRLAKAEAVAGTQQADDDRTTREQQARQILIRTLVDDLGWPEHELEAHLARSHRPLHDLLRWAGGVFARTTPPWHPTPPEPPPDWMRTFPHHSPCYPPGTHYLPPPGWFATWGENKAVWLADNGGPSTIWKRGDTVIPDPWVDEDDPPDPRALATARMVAAYVEATTILYGPPPPQRGYWHWPDQTPINEGA